MAESKCKLEHCADNDANVCPFRDEIIEDAQIWADPYCEEFHWSDFGPAIQDCYTRLTGDPTDWTKCRTEPWWSLGGLFNAPV